MHDITRATDPCFRKKTYSTLGRMAYRGQIGGGSPGRDSRSQWKQGQWDWGETELGIAGLHDWSDAEESPGHLPVTWLCD